MTEDDEIKAALERFQESQAKFERISVAFLLGAVLFVLAVVANLLVIAWRLFR